MASKNTIEYGISQVHYSVITYDQDTNESTYSKPKPLKGATTLNLDVVGDNTTIFADNIAYFIATSNQGYSGTLTIIKPTSDFLTEVFNLLPDNNKVNVEYSHNTIKEIALGFQVEGDQERRRIWLYRVSVGRPVQEHKTKAETLEADTYSIALKVIPRQDDNAIKIFVNENDSLTAYSGWFDEVYKIMTKKLELNTVITKSTLTDFQGVGDTPTNDELEAQIIIDNPNYQKDDAVLSDITTTSAVATANPTGKYQGIVNLSYTYTKKQAVQKK